MLKICPKILPRRCGYIPSSYGTELIAGVVKKITFVQMLFFLLESFLVVFSIFFYINYGFSQIQVCFKQVLEI